MDEPYAFVGVDTCVAVVVGTQCPHQPSFTVASYPTCRRHVTLMLDVVIDRGVDAPTVRRIE